MQLIWRSLVTQSFAVCKTAGKRQILSKRLLILRLLPKEGCDWYILKNKFNMVEPCLTHAYSCQFHGNDLNKVRRNLKAKRSSHRPFWTSQLLCSAICGQRTRKQSLSSLIQTHISSLSTFCHGGVLLDVRWRIGSPRVEWSRRKIGHGHKAVLGNSSWCL